MRPRYRHIVLGAIVASSLAGGCSVTLRPDEAEPSVANVCSDNAACGSKGVCVDGACFARSGSIDELLLEVVPDTSAFAPDSGLKEVAAIPGLSFLIHESGILSGDRARLVRAPSVREFSGKVQTSSANAAGCASSGKDIVDIAAKVTFTRGGSLRGLPVSDVQQIVKQVDTGTNKGLNFQASLVPGTYDVYVEPSCSAAPLLISGLDVGSDIDPMKVPAVLNLPAPASLSGKVTWKNGVLTDWEVSLIEPRQGRRISTVQKLGSGDTTNFSITYQNVIAADGSVPASPIIQIAPPQNTNLTNLTTPTRPTVYWVLYAADLLGTGTVGLELTGLPTNPVTIRGQLQGSDGTAGVAGVVYFFSSELQGNPGVNANFTQRVTTDEMGHYVVGLLPGRYRVVAIPGPATGLDVPTAGPTGVPVAGSTTGLPPWAITERSKVDFLANGPTSYDIPLDQQVTIEGRATLPPNDTAAINATLQAMPSSQASRSGALLDALAQTAISPRAISPIELRGNGAFGAWADPGTYDLTIRPDVDSDYAWWVYPTFSVDSSANPPRLDAALPLPVALDGRVVDGATAMGQALVRAFAVTPSRDKITQVGATHTDANGNFRLRLPSTLVARPVGSADD